MKGSDGALRPTSRRIRSRPSGSIRSALERMAAEARFSELIGSRSSPRREEPAQAERIEGVEHHEVEVAGQAAVLEAVVEDDQLGFQLVHGDPGERDAIGILEMRDVGEVQQRTNE